MLRKTLSFFLFLFLLWAVGLLWFSAQIPREPAADTQTTDAIVVLTGGSLRLEHGFNLLAQKRAKIMFISGVEDNVGIAALMKKKEYHEYLAQIPWGSVELGHQARSTLGNAVETADWIARRHIASIRLVTGNYHIPRSMYEIHEATPGVIIIPDPVFPSHFANNEWWQWETSVRLVISEYHKYLISILAHTLLSESR